MKMWRIVTAVWCLLVTTTAAPGLNPASLSNIANVTYATDPKPIDVASLFAPRMDFEQWKPLTGRGDPLRNDPTYDYEPPVLDRVHYWADDTRPERKSEVLMLGVSSRNPSVPSRPPPRRQHRPSPIKYEDFTYKLSERYPMTILVPPPPPPPGHKPPLYVLTEEKLTTPEHTRTTERPNIKNTVTSDDTSYSLQESNLIYQSSTTSQNWISDAKQTQSLPNTAVSSDYAGWGPTTPIDDEDPDNERHNFIINDNFEISKHPFSFYRPMLSEAPPPPPPEITPNPLLLPTLMPTVLPPTTTTTTTEPPRTTPPPLPTETTTETFIPETSLNINEELTTPAPITFYPTAPPPPPPQMGGMLGMLGSMFSMPMTEPERPEDHLYAHASENLHVFKEHSIEDTTTIESMQTMHPPPPSVTTDTPMMHSHRPFHVDPHRINNLIKKPSTLDPYLNMRYSTPMPTIAGLVESFENSLTSTEAPSVPKYLIIQGHSKVKTYSSKLKSSEEKEEIVNEIPKPGETDEVKHLHPIKEKNMMKIEKSDPRGRMSRAHNLKDLVNSGVGSIEIQEADVGIKYDISDGSDVPVELYRKGIVENEVNNYGRNKNNRSKRQISLEDFIPFDEEEIEEFVYDFIDSKKNSTDFTRLLASALSGETADAVDEIEEDIDEDSR